MMNPYRIMNFLAADGEGTKQTFRDNDVTTGSPCSEGNYFNEMLPKTCEI
jgi:hypothetical protein